MFFFVIRDIEFILIWIQKIQTTFDIGQAYTAAEFIPGPIEGGNRGGHGLSRLAV